MLCRELRWIRATNHSKTPTHRKNSSLSQRSMSSFDQLNETERAEVTAKALELTSTSAHRLKDFDDRKEQLAREALLRRSETVVHVNNPVLNDRTITISDATLPNSMVFTGSSSMAGSGNFVSPSSKRPTSDSGRTPSPATKRVKVSSPSPIQAILAGTQDIFQAKKIGSEALDEAHWYKQALYRAQHTNKIKAASRYRQQRDEAHKHSQRYCTERDTARKNEEHLRKQLTDAVQQLEESRKNEKQAVEQLEESRKNENYEKGRADFFESEFDRVCYHVSRL